MALTDAQERAIRNNLSMVNTNSATGTPTPTAVSSAAFGTPTGIAKIDANIQSLTNSTVLRFPLDTPKYSVMIQPFNFSRQNLDTIGSLTPFHPAMVLPLPAQMVDAHDVKFDELPIGFKYGAAVNIGKNAADASMKNTLSASDVFSAAKNFPGKAYEWLKENGGAAAVGGAAALDVKEPVQRILSAFLGYSPNQFMTILLRGPSYKRYNFTWTLSPNSEAESVVLKDIINKLNNMMAPGTALGGAIFSFPKVFQCYIIPNAQFMYKFKPAVLEMFHVNYVPAGVPAFNRAMSDGQNAPVSVQISVQFLELEYWLTGDFVDTSDPRVVRGPDR